MFLDQLNTIQERSDKRADRMEEAWSKLREQLTASDIEAARVRMEMHNQLTQGHDQMIANMQTMTDILRRIARKMDAE